MGEQLPLTLPVEIQRVKADQAEGQEDQPGEQAGA